MLNKLYQLYPNLIKSIVIYFKNNYGLDNSLLSNDTFLVFLLEDYLHQFYNIIISVKPNIVEVYYYDSIIFTLNSNKFTILTLKCEIIIKLLNYLKIERGESF
jgi:hypothetical protein